MPRSRGTRSVENLAKQEIMAASVPDGLKPERIQFMGKDDLLRLQQHFRLGDTWGVITIPEEWTRNTEAAGEKNIKLAKRLTSKYTSNPDDAELACLTLVRLILLCMCARSQTGPHNPSLLDINSIRSKLTTHWLRLVAVALTKSPREDGALFGRLSPEDLPTSTPGMDQQLETEIRRLNDYARRGLWWDVVQTATASERESSNKKSRRERRPKTDPVQYKPLPDAFVLEAGKRAVWLSHKVLPQALRVYDHILTLGEGVHPDTAGTRAQKYLETVKWDMGDHAPLSTEPYSIDTAVKGHHDEWPPRDLDQFNALLRVCQTANYFIAGLSGGARASEVLSFRMDCLREARDGTPLIDGKTYKLEESFEGEWREWPMPEAALQAVQNQVALARLIDRSTGESRGENVDGSGPLWRIIASSNGHGNALRDSYNEYLRDFAVRTKTANLLDEQAFTNHRFRKTIARLVALAMVNAPKILMDIFGHRTIEMTMHYILTDKTLRTEILQIQKDILEMTVRKAIENADKNGGPAAKKIQAEVQRIKFVRAREDLQAEDINELVLRWTAVNREWMFAREGVLCTKMKDQVGACAKGRSTPNPARCNSGCDHRLEEADYIGQVDGILNNIVKNIQVAQAKNDVILMDLWEGQLHAHIKRFDALYDKWSVHPVVKQILERPTEEAIDVE